MIRLHFSLHQLPFGELIDDCLYILAKDGKELNKQSAIYEQAVTSGKRSSHELEKWRERLIHLQNRNEFFEALVCRVQTIDLFCIISSIGLATNEANLRGTPNEFALTIYFKPDSKPFILIH